MSLEMDDFFSALKDDIDSEVTRIRTDTDLTIKEIQEKNIQKIEALRKEKSSRTSTRLLLECFHKELSDKQLNWMERINNEEGNFLDQLFEVLPKNFSAIAQTNNNLFVKMFNEVKDRIGDDFTIHISKTSDLLKFKTETGITQEVIADLEQTGIIIQRKDVPIVIENTLESRLEKIKENLRIQASHSLWGDINIFPWHVKEIMTLLLDMCG